MELWSALIVGLAGSLHCIGMCGPIAVALPAGRTSRLRHIVG
ncbi:MAG: sulfite exporter TauE/SafE family protein, partial [candidate division Zixibacteria bacterium]|nr:sulfite exporter TauE/SafE family protein [candidate division Zixibacteria bacterium]